jgi:predicted alpha-1,2-mannosidase
MMMTSGLFENSFSRASGKLTALLFGAYLFAVCAPCQTSKPNHKLPLDYVNGLVGTAPLDKQELIGNAPPPGERLYSGMTSPGAVLPHGAIILAPINRNVDLAYGAGVQDSYFYPNRTMMGFSTGAGPILMPVVGNWTVAPERSASVYDKASEKSSPGYYSVYLDDFRTKAEMTVAPQSGIFRFTFPRSDKSNLLLDLGRAGGTVEIVGNETARGQMARGRGGQPGGAYFVAEFSRPFKSFGVLRQIPPTGSGSLIGGKDVEPDQRTISGNYAGAYLQFSTTQGEQVLVRIASGPNYAAAEDHLHADSAQWNFERIRHEAEDAWTRKLSLIEVTGGTEKEKTLFYSCLYHSFFSPRLVARKGESLIGSDGQLTTAAYDRYGPVPYWDTGRNQIVLLTMIEPSLMENVLQSQLDMARETGYMGTSFHGDHAVFMYLGAWERGLSFDWAGVFEYLRKNAMDVNGPRHYLAEFLKQGWISDFIPDRDPSPPYADGKAGVATTLEYSWDDHAMALFAKKLGKDDDYEMFLRRSHNYQNVFDPSIGFMRGRTDDGKWIAPFDPREPYYNFMMKEASGWSTLWLVPHDVQGLANLLGGREKFAAKLDEFFSTPYHPKGICRDCTGVIGQYVQGNQPDQQAAYLYDWAGRPWKTQELTRRILKLMYGSDQYGLAFPGMDDQGSTASWYVMSAMGFYPVDPSSPDYIMGSPIFDHVTIHMENGKNFEIVARNNSEKNLYIQSATINGKAWNKPWFSQADIANGARLVLEMGPQPNKQWGAAPDAAPPSMSQPQ